MNRKYYHILPHFHYDVVFVNTYENYLKITLDIIKKALEMMDRVKGYTFGVEQTIVLEEFIKRYPELKSKLARALKTNRMEITCGMYCMPDMNLASGESLIRQIKRGKEWLQAEFGINPRICIATDCFGHHRQIPQILKKCGYDYYSFSRGMLNLSPTEFWWKGIDGTKILTHWNYRGYGSGWSYLLSQDKKWDDLRDSATDISRLAVTDNVLIMLGGDFCPPIPHSVEILEALSQGKNKAFFSTLTGYMDAVQNTFPKIATIAKEFNPMLEGCYSTRIYFKQTNRLLENEILTLEKLCALTGIKEPDRKMLSQIWDDILRNQFHDTICGSIIDKADVWARKNHIRAQTRIAGMMPKKIQQLAEQFTGKGKQPALAVFNPTPSVRNQSITFNPVQPIAANSLADNQNKTLPIQKTDTGYVFVDSLPPLGIKTYRFSQGTFGHNSLLKISPESMENRFYRLTLSNGVIQSLVDKKSREEFVNPKMPLFNVLALQRDEGDPWILYQQPVNGDIWQPLILPDPMPAQLPTKEWYFIKTKYLPICDRTDYQKNEITVAEDGPVRIGLKVKGTLLLGPALKVSYEQSIFLYQGLRRIDFATRIIPSGKRYRLRACFATRFKNPEIVHEIPCGAEKRVPGEFPAVNWVNYREDDTGLLLLNRGLPGNNFQDGVAMLSLFRSVAMELRGDSEGCYGEGIEHLFEYAVIPYTRNNPVNPGLEGQCYNTRIPTTVIKTETKQIINRSFVKSGPENIILSAFYREDKGYTIRIYESEGKKTQGYLKLVLPVKRVVETDCFGNKIAHVPVIKGEISFGLKSFEIKTYLFQTD